GGGRGRLGGAGDARDRGGGLRARPARARGRARRAAAPDRRRGRRRAGAGRARSAAAAVDRVLSLADGRARPDARRQRFQTRREHRAEPSARDTASGRARRCGGLLVSGLPFERFAARNPDALAVGGPSGDRWSRRRLSAVASGIAHGLLARGVRPGDVVAIVAPNCAEYLAVFIAAVSAGLRIVPVNWHLSRDE